MPAFRSCLLVLLCFCTTGLRSQQIDWSARLSSFFDNTEFEGSLYQSPQTMAGIRFAPELEFSKNTEHTIHAGVDLLKKFGSKTLLDDYSPIVYYKYSGSAFRFYLGSFPRIGLLDAYSRAFFQDSIAYYRPNLNGMLWAFKRDALQATAFLDWTGYQTEEEHEKFFVGGLLRYDFSTFFVEAHGLMHHYAGSKTLSGVRDMLLAQANLGLSLSDHVFLDALVVRLGYLGGFERNRSMDFGWQIRPGWMADVVLEWKQFGLHSTQYLGKGLIVDYAQMGSQLYWGDPFFRGRSYNRTDLSYRFFKKQDAQLKLNLSQHFSGGRCYVEQSLLLNVAF
ncbi:MAG: hypothetical protein PHN20_08025 [Bacteroidales bacterium]|nr:hypothetical protein [Bacteroidales bacterium]